MRQLLATFVVSFALLHQAAAQDAVCSGRSLLGEIQDERPELWREALEEFEAVPNGTGLFWRIERAGVAPSWLLGTMHVADPQITDLRSPVAAAFAAADAVVLESVDVVDPARKRELAERMMSIARLPEGETFDAAFTPEEREALAAMTAAHGVPYFMARRMKPWFMSVLLSMPPCVGAASLRGEPVLDEKLFVDAVAAGKDVRGLETIEEQFEAVANLETTIDATALLEILKLGPQGVEDWYATLVDLYREEMVTLLIPLLDRLPEFAAMASAMEDAEAHLVVLRNRRMHERLLPMLEGGGVFVAVGALHLSGETGLIELLRASGYLVTRVQ
jgi:uncharacterized protein